MKFAVIGLGSMGKRRVRDLLALGHEVIGFDVRADRLEEVKNRFSINFAKNITELYQHDLNGCVISTPPDAHYFYYEKNFSAKIPFFSEANIFTPRSTWFRSQEKSSGIKSFPSATWMFHPLFKKLKDNIATLGYQNVNTVSYQYGGFLPFWHPWESYADFYAGKKHTSAAREMVPFELEALTWIFGNVVNVTAKHYRSRQWLTDIDDTYYLLMEFASGIRGSLLIELHQAAPYRTLRVSCQEDNFCFDVGNNIIEHYHLPDNIWKKIKPDSVRALTSFNFEDVYFAEIKAFVDAIQGNDYPKTWEQDRHLSDVLYAAELSAKENRTIAVQTVNDLYDGVSWITQNESCEIM